MKALAEQINELDGVEIYGRVVGVRGLMVEVAGPLHAMSVGARVIIETPGKTIPSEVIGFSGPYALLMPFAPLEGVRRGCRALVTSVAGAVRPSAGWLGRVVNALGEPIDGKGPLLYGPSPYAFRNAPPLAHARRRVGAPLDLGVRALNTFITCCRGQRMGIFSGSGVGKSVLLSMFARNVNADVTVIGLIGERGREVQEFLQDDLGEAGLARSVVVVSTSDEPALMRRQAAHVTLAIAEYFRDEGQDVLVLMDSVTRFAMAQREIGLSAGEPPTAKGYTPTVFTELPRLLASRPWSGSGYHHGYFHRAGRWRRPQRADRRRRAGHPRRPYCDGTLNRRAWTLSGHQRAQIGIAHHAACRRSGLPARADPRPPGDGDLCGHGRTHPARRLPRRHQPRGRRGDSPEQAARGISRPR
jgi:flagellum-specific ATP synthase